MPFFQKKGHHKITPTRRTPNWTGPIGLKLSGATLANLTLLPQTFPPKSTRYLGGRHWFSSSTTTGDDPLITEHFSSNEEAKKNSARGKRRIGSSPQAPPAPQSPNFTVIFWGSFWVWGLVVFISSRQMIWPFFLKVVQSPPDLRYMDLI